MQKSTPNKYGSVAVTIHWLTVLLIAVVLAVTALPVSVLLDQLAGTSLVSHVWAGDEVSATGGG